MTTEKYQTGLGLIEVLVSLLILGVAILGFAYLQTRSISASSESLVRANALNLMRDLGDKIRYNISAKATYATELNTYMNSFNGTGASAPTLNCGLYGGSSACDPDQQAKVDTYMAAKQAFENGYSLKMVTCPSTSGRVQCLISSWGKTNPTLGTDSNPNDSNNTMDCMTSAGIYHSKSECMILELL